jgi:hypothetical protein
MKYPFNNLIIKNLKKIHFPLFLILTFSVSGFGQFCADFHKLGDWMN